MGNSASSSGKGHQDDTVDFGYLVPCGVYTGPRDWNQAIVSQLICARRLAPFYRPLEEYDESWDDDQILSARKEFPPQDDANPDHISTRTESTVSAGGSTRASGLNKRSGTLKEPSKPEAAVYRGAVECPICFLYYPPNINHSRCCDQAICTECFVQIKRAEPTTTHLVSEPAACPYCVQEDFGIVYNPPPWRSGIGSEGSYSLWSDSSKNSHPTVENSPYPTHKRRQKSFSADSPEVVTTDHIRPDWEAKLAAVRAAVARRANRRIIMRQVGDRLIPVGVTSGRVHPLSPEEAAAAGADGEGGSRRSRRRQQPGNAGFEQYVGLAGPDLEELMVMEAMRLSLIDHEEQQKKQAEEKRKAEARGEANLDAESSTGAAGPSSSPSSGTPTSSHRPLTTLKDALRIRGNSRSRSPSPANASAGNSHTRGASPPAFSTLNAALSTVATASAVLARDSDPTTETDAPPSADNAEDNITVTVRQEDDEQPTEAAPTTSSQSGPQTGTGLKDKNLMPSPGLGSTSTEPLLDHDPSSTTQSTTE